MGRLPAQRYRKTAPKPGSLVIDTHTTVWYPQQDPRLSLRAEAEIDQALANGFPIYVPSISVVEIVYLIDKGRIPTVVADRVRRVLHDPASGFQLAALDLNVAACTARISRDAVPDLPDRVIASTALALDLPLVTRDSRITSSGIQTVW